jgi:hypothetical protein
MHQIGLLVRPLEVRLLPHRNLRSWRGEIRQTPITLPMTVHGSPHSNPTCYEKCTTMESQVCNWVHLLYILLCSTCHSRLVDDMPPSAQRDLFFFSSEESRHVIDLRWLPYDYMSQWLASGDAATLTISLMCACEKRSPYQPG